MAKAEADTEAERVAADNKTVNDAITAATTAIAALTGESSAEDVADVRAKVMEAQTALDGVQNLSEEQVASLQTMIDAIDTSDLEAQETRIADAAEEERMAEEAARVAAATKAAGTKRMAIEAEAAQTAGGTPGTDGTGGADAGLGGSSAPTTTSGAEGEYTLGIKWDDETDAQPVSITVEGASC